MASHVDQYLSICTQKFYGFCCSAHGSVGRNPDGSYYYTHGAFLGHIVPGLFFAVSTSN